MIEEHQEKAPIYLHYLQRKILHVPVMIPMYSGYSACEWGLILLGIIYDGGPNSI